MTASVDLVVNIQVDYHLIRSPLYRTLFVDPLSDLVLLFQAAEDLFTRCSSLLLICPYVIALYRVHYTIRVGLRVEHAPIVVLLLIVLRSVELSDDFRLLL